MQETKNIKTHEQIYNEAQEIINKTNPNEKISQEELEWFNSLTNNNNLKRPNKNQQQEQDM